jgi:hypothetical protein
MISFINYGVVYLFTYFSVPAIVPPIDAPSAALCSDTAGPASDPIAPPTNAPTVEPMLPLSVSVTLSPDAMSVNTQRTYMKYKFPTVLNMEVM